MGSIKAGICITSNWEDCLFAYGIAIHLAECTLIHASVSSKVISSKAGVSMLSSFTCIAIYDRVVSKVNNT